MSECNFDWIFNGQPPWFVTARIKWQTCTCLWRHLRILKKRTEPSERLVKAPAPGIAACAAIADTWGAAHGIARFAGRQMVVASREQSASMMEAPIAALRLPSDMLCRA